jgi:hypothetical protein
MYEVIKNIPANTELIVHYLPERPEEIFFMPAVHYLRNTLYRRTMDTILEGECVAAPARYSSPLPRTSVLIDRILAAHLPGHGRGRSTVAMADNAASPTRVSHGGALRRVRAGNRCNFATDLVD